jgi:hypothetical protein
VPAVRQKLHLSSCADFRGQLSLTAVQEFRQPCFSPGNREIFKKNREAIEHERAITERD